MEFLYNTAIGRIILKPLSSRTLANICGAFMDTPLSTFMIKSFVRKNSIDLSEYESRHYHSFNDFFTRQIKSENRPIDYEPTDMIAPCDGLLSAYKITAGLVIPIKQSKYSIGDLLKDEALAAEFDGGYCLVYRLCVNNYHRYCYVDDGIKGENIFIKGILHTVRPVALRAEPIFIENCREYTVIDTANHGKIIQMEVGAMLIGKIKNHHGSGEVKRGTEKGMFLYGGSTVIVLVKKDQIELNEELLESTANDIETQIKFGSKIGKKYKRG